MTTEEKVIELLRQGVREKWDYMDYRINCPFKPTDRLSGNLKILAMKWRVREMNPADKGMNGKLREVAEDVKGKDVKTWGTYHAKRQGRADLYATINGTRHGYEFKTGAGDWYVPHAAENLTDALKEYRQRKGNGYIRWYVKGEFEIKMQVADFLDSLTEYDPDGLAKWFTYNPKTGKLLMKPITKKETGKPTKYIQVRMEFLRTVSERNIEDWFEMYE